MPDDTGAMPRVGKRTWRRLLGGFAIAVIVAVFASCPRSRSGSWPARQGRTHHPGEQLGPAPE